MTRSRDTDTRSAMARGLQWSAFMVLGIILIGAFLTGCAPDPTTAGAETAATIYATVVRQIYTVDDTFGGTLAPRVLYIVRNTDDAAGDPNAERLPSVTLSQEVQDNITAALGDLPARIEWVDSRDEVPLDPEAHRVADEGAIITLGNLHFQGDGTVHVPASIWVAMLAAGGQTYVLEQVHGTWTITGTTGPVWMS